MSLEKSIELRHVGIEKGTLGGPDIEARKYLFGRIIAITIWGKCRKIWMVGWNQSLGR